MNGAKADQIGGGIKSQTFFPAHCDPPPTKKMMTTLLATDGAVPACVMAPDDVVIRVSSLGSGSSSTVFLAYTRGGGSFVVKHIVRRVARHDRMPTQNAGLINGVPAEAVVLSSLPRHQHVVRYLSMSVAPGAYLVFFQHRPASATLTTLLEGTSNWCSFVTGYIREPITRRVLGLRDSIACALAHQLFDAVAHCHANNVAHRDIKTDNILVTWIGTDEPDPAAGGAAIAPGFHLTLIDFGFATWCGDGVPPACTFPGTDRFAAPELLSGTPYDPRRSDVWACGVVFYAMLLARFPFVSHVREDLVREICMSEPPFHRNGRTLCDAAIALLRTMMAKDAALRPSIASAYSNDWLVAMAATLQAPVPVPPTVPVFYAPRDGVAAAIVTS